MLTKKDTTQLLQAFTKVFATKQDAKKQHAVVMKKLEKLDKIEGDVKIAQSDIQSIKGDIKTVRGDVQVLKGDMKTVQSDIASMKSDIKTVQGDVQTMKSNIKTVQETLSNLTDMTGDILSWTNDIHQEIVMEKLPKRVHRIEKHLGFPVLAD